MPWDTPICPASVALIGTLSTPGQPAPPNKLLEVCVAEDGLWQPGQLLVAGSQHQLTLQLFLGFSGYCGPKRRNDWPQYSWGILWGVQRLNTGARNNIFINFVKIASHTPRLPETPLSLTLVVLSGTLPTPGQRVWPKPKGGSFSS